MDGEQTFIVFVPRARWAQDSAQWYLNNPGTCWLEAVKDARRGGYALFCRGEHYGFIGHITMWPFQSAMVDLVGCEYGQASDDPDDQFIRSLRIVKKSDEQN